jgi:hypothetical protein
MPWEMSDNQPAMGRSCYYNPHYIYINCILYVLEAEIRNTHPLRQRPRDIGEITELCYHIGVMFICCLLLHFSYVHVYMVVITSHIFFLIL